MPGEIEKAAAVATGPLRLSLRSEYEGLFRISHLTLSISGLPKQFDGYRLVQLTDLHFGPATSAAHIERSIEITNSLKPNSILLTGDYVQFSATGLGHKIAKRFNPKAFRWIDYRREVRELAHRLGKLLAPLSPADGIFGVFGNHDHLRGWARSSVSCRAQFSGSTTPMSRFKRGRLRLFSRGSTTYTAVSQTCFAHLILPSWMPRSASRRQGRILKAPC